MQERMVVNKAFTHAGKFHADDVFSSALLRILFPTIEIIRGFEVPESFEGIVFDIGMGEYDHHQKNSEVRENGCPYAAFGLLWRRLENWLLEEEESKEFDEKSYINIVAVYTMEKIFDGYGSVFCDFSV